MDPVLPATPGLVRRAVMISMNVIDAMVAVILSRSVQILPEAAHVVPVRQVMKVQVTLVVRRSTRDRRRRVLKI